jgi:hypothetical protein
MRVLDMAFEFTQNILNGDKSEELNNERPLSNIPICLHTLNSRLLSLFVFSFFVDTIFIIIVFLFFFI